MADVKGGAVKKFFDEGGLFSTFNPGVENSNLKKTKRSLH
jgi:hypothetical protein